MRRMVICLLALLLCPALAARGEETAVSGYVMEAEAFYALEASFRERAFAGDAQSVELTETQTLMFVCEAPARMLPSLTVMIRQAVPLLESMEQMVGITQSLLETMQVLQAQHPEAFLFNEERAMAHAETGFRFAVAEEDLWLWAQDGSGVMLPFFFYDGESGAMIDGVYLLTVVIVGPQSAYYALYNGAELVLDYLMCVEVASNQSDFQRAVVQWYLGTFVDAQAEDAGLGSLRITVKAGRVRAEGGTDAKVVGTVRQDQVYPILSVAKSGWYEIELEGGMRGFISPALCEKVE
ncbi:SH3 domain-containing protein [Eubacteriales bacterium OttesenSCG-928-A19]|nr:SH3 domain-containing protein [Eubacteriales bacterium OttesenSCG-928-A19]